LDEAMRRKAVSNEITMNDAGFRAQKNGDKGLEMMY
jgi:hypothetical protein